jgi:hypothetical protein
MVSFLIDNLLVPKVLRCFESSCDEGDAFILTPAGAGRVPRYCAAHDSLVEMMP